MSSAAHAYNYLKDDIGEDGNGEGIILTQRHTLNIQGDKKTQTLYFFLFTVYS